MDSLLSDLVALIARKLSDITLCLLTGTSRTLQSIVTTLLLSHHFNWLRTQDRLLVSAVHMEQDWVTIYRTISIALRLNNPFTDDVLRSSICLRLLLSSPVTDPRVEYNATLPRACAGGYTEAVNILLQDKRVNPESRRNRGFVDACELGHTEIVRLLLARGIDPTSRNHEGFFVACKLGHVEIVRLLIEVNQEVDQEDDRKSIVEASSRGHCQVVQILLRRKTRINRYSLAFEAACKFGQFVVASSLIDDGRVDVLELDEFTLSSLGTSGIFLMACKEGYEDIVRMLLDDGRIDPSRDNNKALRQSRKANHWNIVNLLLSDSRVSAAVN